MVDTNALPPVAAAYHLIVVPVAAKLATVGEFPAQIEIRPRINQIDDLMEEIHIRSEKNERVLVTTLTKRMAEELQKYFDRMNIRCRYIHSDVDTMERVEIMEQLRKGVFDVLIGINLLREGLDLPEVSLVAILDADKEGFLRSERSLTQTAGRAARNLNGLVIMYADKITDSMQRTIDSANYRRIKQYNYNIENGITPTQIIKPTREIIGLEYRPDKSVMGKAYIAREKADVAADPVVKYMSTDALEKTILMTQKEMAKAAKELDFIEAARLRDEMYRLKELLKQRQNG